MVNDADAAADGMASPSSQEAWCGSPQAICTTATPRSSMSRSSSGTLFSCNDQLQTPIASGSTVVPRWCRTRSTGRGFDVHAERAEVAALTLLVRRLYLLLLQLGHFLRAGPDHGPTRGVGLQHQLHRPLGLEPQRLAQHLDDELHRVVVVVLQDH